MSLLNKPVAEITLHDVEVFCQQKRKEGPRLDYKRKFTDSHVKLICAFANTVGGMIILGVDTDDNNQPIWPPQHGLASTAGLEDRIIQMTTDGITPPVRPHVSAPLTDPATGKSVMVVRVDESPQAPHAVESGHEVLVYERVQSVGLPNFQAASRVDQ